MTLESHDQRVTREAKMGKHEFVDRLAVALGSLYGDSLRFFRDGVDSPHVSELVREVSADVPPPDSPTRMEVPMRYRDREMQAAYRVFQWAGPRAPAIIFHHGSGDYPFDRRVAKVFGGNRAPDGVTIIATTIPFNTSGKMEYVRAVGRLENFALMLAGATILIEGVLSHLRAGGCRTVTVGGMSLGGWITNMHKAYFDSATDYRPVFAGAAPDHLFRETVYSKMAAKAGREHPEAISAVLNFERDFESVDNRNVFPLLARYDQYIMLERQSRIYQPGNVAVIDYGHVTGSMQNDLLAQHLSRSALTVARSS